jgi:dTDP-glucose pyrophosphorylase
MKALIIIPAAGFGRRMGSPLAKELLLSEDGKPMIEFCLEIAKEYDLPIHVVSRKDKESLNSYIRAHDLSQKKQMALQLIDSSREWSDTVLQSQSFWQEKNILLLPDTRFAPRDVVEKICRSSTSFQAGVFEVKDPQNWGIVRAETNGFSIAEKPKSVLREGDSVSAWGVLGFSNKLGEALFQSMLSPRVSDFQFFAESYDFFELTSFKDLGRPL